jgi:TPR repeat protein
MCEGFPEENGRDAWRYLLRAAQAGHPGSMLRFLWTTGFNHQGPMDDLDQWLAYRDNAPGILERAVEMGYPEAYEVAARMNEGRWFGGKSALPRDIAKAQAYDLALSRVTDPQGSTNAASRVRTRIEKGEIDAAGIARAESMAMALASKLDTTRPKLSILENTCESIER